VVGPAPVPETAELRSGRVPVAVPVEPPVEAVPPSPSSNASSSGSRRSDISLVPPSTTKRIAAITRFTTRLARKTVISLEGSPLSSITELVMVP